MFQLGQTGTLQKARITEQLAHSDGDEYEGGKGGLYSVVTFQGCARDLHALCASGGSLTSPIGKNICVLAAGTIEDREELEGSGSSRFKEQANINLDGMIIRTTAMEKYLHDITDQTRYTTGTKKGLRLVCTAGGSGVVCLD